jgi:hypothetical protein
MGAAKDARATRPATVAISPFDYRVRYEVGLSDKAGVSGLCNTDTLTIFIDGELPDALEPEVVLHEALHAIWTQTGLDKKYSDEEEEEAVWQLAPRILALLRDNPRMVKWMIDGGR